MLPSEAIRPSAIWEMRCQLGIGDDTQMKWAPHFAFSHKVPNEGFGSWTMLSGIIWFLSYFCIASHADRYFSISGPADRSTTTTTTTTT